MAQTSRSSRTAADETDSKLMSASENLARILGVIFIVIGFGLIIALVGGFIVSRLPYRVDPNLPIPTLDSVPAYTNQDALDLTGSALPYEMLVLYQDGERIGTTVETDEDGEFTFKDTVLEEEGEVSYEVAVVRGGIFKRRSEFSNEVVTEVDWTPPSSVVSLEYEGKTETGSTTVKGTADPDVYVVLEGDADTYETETDADGNFSLDITDLTAGDNNLSVRVRDKAGNEVIAATTVTIAYIMEGDLNGPGAATGPNGEQLPESAGELEAAMEFLAGNRLMLLFGMAALVAFGVSSTLAYTRSKQY